MKQVNFVDMDIQATKIELAQRLLSETSEVVLQKIKDILLSEKTDWWDEISEEEKLAIDEGLAELDRGEGISHDQVMNEIQAKYKI